ncbi:hypothetical protein IF2G_08217 [Cordyceps javanica]|nr:hypothetical protein IF2G_08217 [Cordyceps javanica]
MMNLAATLSQPNERDTNLFEYWHTMHAIAILWPGCNTLYRDRHMYEESEAAIGRQGGKEAANTVSTAGPLRTVPHATQLLNKLAK